MIQSKPAVTHWYNNLSLAGKQPVRIKITSNSNSIFAGSAGFSLSESQIFAKLPQTHQKKMSLVIPRQDCVTLTTPPITQTCQGHKLDLSETTDKNEWDCPQNETCRWKVTYKQKHNTFSFTALFERHSTAELEAEVDSSSISQIGMHVAGSRTVELSGYSLGTKLVQYYVRTRYRVDLTLASRGELRMYVKSEMRFCVR